MFLLKDNDEDSFSKEDVVRKLPDLLPSETRQDVSAATIWIGDDPSGTLNDLTML